MHTQILLKKMLYAVPINLKNYNTIINDNYHLEPWLLANILQLANIFMLFLCTPALH